MIFERHANLKYKYGNRNFWAKGYYVSTVGLNKETVAEYIRNQEQEDMMQDKMTSKEYQDPFKGKAIVWNTVVRLLQDSWESSWGNRPL